MKIAIPTNGTQIFQHFGKCEQFTLFTVEDGKIVGAPSLDTSAHGHHLMAGFLKEHGADVVICGGIGQGAKDTLDAQGIALCAGASGDAKQAAQDYLDGRLVHNANASCNHHDGHHHEGGCHH